MAYFFVKVNLILFFRKKKGKSFPSLTQGGKN